MMMTTLILILICVLYRLYQMPLLRIPAIPTPKTKFHRHEPNKSLKIPNAIEVDVTRSLRKSLRAIKGPDLPILPIVALYEPRKCLAPFPLDRNNFSAR